MLKFFHTNFCPETIKNIKNRSLSGNVEFWLVNIISDWKTYFLLNAISKHFSRHKKTPHITTTNIKHSNISLVIDILTKTFLKYFFSLIVYFCVWNILALYCILCLVTNISDLIIFAENDPSLSNLEKNARRHSVLAEFGGLTNDFSGLDLVPTTLNNSLSNIGSTLFSNPGQLETLGVLLFLHLRLIWHF